jgi:hypothetical protein
MGNLLSYNRKLEGQGIFSSSGKNLMKMQACSSEDIFFSKDSSEDMKGP